MKPALILFLAINTAWFAAFGQSCLPNGIIFRMQAQVDDFQINYPGCTEIEGNVFIGGGYEEPCDIYDLNGLNALTSIRGDLVISGECPNPVQSLEGLSNLVSVGGNLELTYLSYLHSLQGLNNLETIGGNLYFNHIYINSLAGLDHLDTIGGDLAIYSVPLLNLIGLPAISRLAGSLVIAGCDSLTNLTGLDWLTHLEGKLEIESNSNLASFTGLENLQMVAGSVSIYGNNRLSNLSGLNNLSFIGGALEIHKNESMDDLSGLGSLREIRGGLGIMVNPVKSLEGLNNLNKVGDFLWIVYNGWLQDVDALANLNSLIGWLRIEDNHSLTNIQGLRNIYAGSISYLNIISNFALFNCHAKSICEYLASPYAVVNIQNNAPGCNSREEVEEACKHLAVDEVKEQVACQVFPNPAREVIHFAFRISQCQWVEIKITDLQGIEVASVLQQRLKAGEQTIPFNTEKFPPGIYLYRLMANGQTANGSIAVIR